MNIAADTDYNEALQTLMKDCLPPILVEIVDKRPLDPIQYMADSLYNYRKKTDENLKRNTVVNTFNNNLLKSDSHRGEQKEKTVSNTLLTSAKVTISECEDFEAENVRTKLHQDCLNIFTDIGDIFDEDDIS